MHCEYANNAYLNRFGKTADAMHTIALRELLGEKAFARREPFMASGAPWNPERTRNSRYQVNGSSALQNLAKRGMAKRKC